MKVFNPPVVKQDFEIPEAGLYKARCIKIIDLGTHFERGVYGGKEIEGYKHKIMIGFELPETVMESEGNEGKPFTVVLFANYSLHKKSNLRPLMEGWIGKKFNDETAKAFNLFSCIDKPAYINIVHNESGENVYANIQAMMPLKEEECPDRINKLTTFYLQDFDEDVFNELSEKMQKRIMESNEWQNREKHKEHFGDPDEDRSFDEDEEEVF